MNKFFTPTCLTAAAALLAACSSTHSRSGYAQHDADTTPYYGTNTYTQNQSDYYTGTNERAGYIDRTRDQYPTSSANQANERYSSGNQYSSNNQPSTTSNDRSTSGYRSSDQYSSSTSGGMNQPSSQYTNSSSSSERAGAWNNDGSQPADKNCPGDRMKSGSSSGDYYNSGRYDNGRYDNGRYDNGRYENGGYDRDRGYISPDPNLNYSSDAGLSVKQKTGSWSQSSAGYSNDHYSSAGEQYNPSSDFYSSSPDSSASSSMNSSSAGSTNVPQHYTNATPGGFDNTWAWHTNGAKTTPLSEFSSSPSSPPSSSSLTNSSSDIAQPVALSGDVSPDARILSILHVKDQEEVEIGRLAATNASSQQAKDFGARLVKDHTEHDAKVRSVASAANISLMDPDQVKAMIAKEKGKSVSDMKDPVAELRNLKGVDFDKKFAMKMKEGHIKVIAMVEKAQYNVTNQNVKDLLAQSLPTLREHEQMAAKLAAGETTNDSYTSPDNR